MRTAQITFLTVLLTGLLSTGALRAQDSTPEATNSGPQKITLETTIRASREQPRVLSIVPWQPPTQKAGLPSPVLERINQRFNPINRAEFIRQLSHFEKLSKR